MILFEFDSDLMRSIACFFSKKVSSQATNHIFVSIYSKSNCMLWYYISQQLTNNFRSFIFKSNSKENMNKNKVVLGFIHLFWFDEQSHFFLQIFFGIFCNDIHFFCLSISAFLLTFCFCSLGWAFTTKHLWKTKHRFSGRYCYRQLI